MVKYNFRHKGQAWRVYRQATDELRVRGEPLNLVKIRDSTITASSDISDRISEIVDNFNFPLKSSK